MQLENHFLYPTIQFKFLQLENSYLFSDKIANFSLFYIDNLNYK